MGGFGWTFFMVWQIYNEYTYFSTISKWPPLVEQIITCDVHFVIQAPNSVCISIMSCFLKKTGVPWKIFKMAAKNQRWPPKNLFFCIYFLNKKYFITTQRPKKLQKHNFNQYTKFYWNQTIFVGVTAPENIDIQGQKSVFFI